MKLKFIIFLCFFKLTIAGEDFTKEFKIPVFSMTQTDAEKAEKTLTPPIQTQNQTPLSSSTELPTSINPPAPITTSTTPPTTIQSDEELAKAWNQVQGQSAQIDSGTTDDDFCVEDFLIRG